MTLNLNPVLLVVAILLVFKIKLNGFDYVGVVRKKRATIAKHLIPCAKQGIDFHHIMEKR
jgi:hypothetical protein